jgi:hypothetical protein
VKYTSEANPKGVREFGLRLPHPNFDKGLVVFVAPKTRQKPRISRCAASLASGQSPTFRSVIAASALLLKADTGRLR